MNVLIGCEESQVVCQAFRDLGHNAFSCDLQPTRGNPEWHYQGNIMDAMHETGYFEAVNLDLIILHPDCTAMALSGNRWYGRDMPHNDKRIKSVEWTLKLWELALKRSDRVCLENPKSVIFPFLRDIGHIVQYIQPWMFGHTENKETGLCLHGLPNLKPTNDVSHLMVNMSKAETDKIHRMPPSPTRKRDRSVTYQGIANAMANQWSK